MQLADVPNESAPSQVVSVEDQAVGKTLLQVDVIIGSWPDGREEGLILGPTW